MSRTTKTTNSEGASRWENNQIQSAEVANIVEMQTIIATSVDVLLRHVKMLGMLQHIGYQPVSHSQRTKKRMLTLSYNYHYCY